MQCNTLGGAFLLVKGCEYCLRPYERISKSKDYELVKREGRRIKSSSFVLNYMPNSLSFHRLGLIVPKRYYKKSFERNRLKRCIREWFRLNKHHLGASWMDLVVIVLPGANRDCKEIAEELSSLCGKIR